jgi:phytoene synthase
MTHPDFSLDGDLRRSEPDLWLSSRLVSDAAARSSLVALYALHGELSKVASAASNPLAGEIRLAWWREEVEALGDAGRSPGHPALQGLKTAPGLDVSALDAMIEARHAELDPRPFADEAGLLAYLDGVDGALMRAAGGLLAPGLGVGFASAGRSWGWARLLRNRPAWRARGRDWTPATWGEATDQEIAAHVRHRVADALKEARADVAGLPVAAFPVIAYAALAWPYAHQRILSELEKRAWLLWASLSGKIS